MAVVTRPLRRSWMSRDVVVSAVTVVTIVTAWTVITTVFRVSPLILPSPRAMGDELQTLLAAGYAGKPLYVHVVASLFRSLTGLVAGIALAVPIGLAMGYHRTVSAALVPVFGFFRPIPPIAFIPLMIASTPAISGLNHRATTEYGGKYGRPNHSGISRRDLGAPKF
jgi:ABC-type nitrate/sulfonate/bicarbonate transport system permease component